MKELNCHMTQAERLQSIIEILSNQKKVKTNVLQQKLGISTSTLRRDLIGLELTNTVKRDQGYVSLLKNSNVEMTYAIRRSENEAAKKKLCSSAAQRIHNNQAIFLDGSSTLAFLPKYFAGKRQLHIITNNLHIATEVNQLQNIKLSILGGEVPYQSNSILGYRALRDLVQNYRPDIAFMSCNSLDEHGIYMANEEQNALKQMLLQTARKVILLVDHSKFGRHDYILMTPFEQANIAEIICDQKPSVGITQQIAHAKIKLTIA